MLRRPPISTLYPYTPLFRSAAACGQRARIAVAVGLAGRGRRPGREPLVDGEVRPGVGDGEIAQHACRTQRGRDVVWATGHGLPRSTAVARTYYVRRHEVTAA